MKADLRDARPPQQRVEPTVDQLLGRQWAAGGAAEDQLSILPGSAGVKALRELRRPMAPERVDRPLAEPHGPPGALGLGLGDLDPARTPHQASCDAEDSPIEVHLRPAEAKELPPAHTCRQSQDEEGSIAVALRRRDELSRL